MFMAANRSKRGLVLDYRTPAGLQSLLRILAQVGSSRLVALYYRPSTVYQIQCLSF